MERLKITKEQAVSLLEKEDEIHTFRQAGGAVLGFSYSWESMMEKIESAKVLEIGGRNSRNIGHGLVINESLFVEASEEKIQQLENQEL